MSKTAKNFRFPKTALSAEEIYALRTPLWSDNELLEEFIRENPYKLSPEDLEVCASWRRRIQGSFWITRYLKKHTVFYDQKKIKPFTEC